MTIRRTPRIEEFRIFESDTPGAYESYNAFCTVVWWRSNIVNIIGLRGNITIASYKQIIAKLYEMGARILYVERAPNHRLSFGTKIESGDFQNMWRLDTEEVNRKFGRT